MKNPERTFVSDEHGNLEVKPTQEKEKPAMPGERVFYGDAEGNVRLEDEPARRKAVADDFAQQLTEKVEMSRAAIEARRKKKEAK